MTRHSGGPGYSALPTLLIPLLTALQFHVFKILHFYFIAPCFVLANCIYLCVYQHHLLLWWRFPELWNIQDKLPHYQKLAKLDTNSALGYVSKSYPVSQIRSKPVSINEVLLEHKYTHLLVTTLCCHGNGTLDHRNHLSQSI